MSSAQPQQQPPADPRLTKNAKTLHNAALAAIVICPVLALLPPRKFDIYTITLCGSTLYCGNYLVQERTGRTIWQNINASRDNKAIDTPTNDSRPAERSDLNRELDAARRQMQTLESVTGVSVTEKIKAKNQRDAWKAQREQEIKDDIEEGKGFGDMIMDQVWEVWNWGKTKDDDED